MARSELKIREVLQKLNIVFEESEIVENDFVRMGKTFRPVESGGRVKLDAVGTKYYVNNQDDLDHVLNPVRFNWTVLKILGLLLLGTLLGFVYRGYIFMAQLSQGAV